MQTSTTATKVMAIPLQPTFQQEVMLAQIGQALNSDKINDDDRVELLFQRAVLFDSLGMRALARNDFSQVQLMRPDIAELYNFLGIYYTLDGNYDGAYEAFDSALELTPSFSYVYFNRGIALYYNNRYVLSQKDLKLFYEEQPNDPYRSLWLYITEREIDPKIAKADLLQRYNSVVRGDWGWNIVEFYLGKISENTLIKKVQIDVKENSSLAEHLCEIHFYLGKHYLSLGEKDTAMSLFKLSVANNVHHFIEHRYALLELALQSQNQNELSELNTK